MAGRTVSTPSHYPAGFPPFRRRAPWWGGDLQTVRNLLVGRAPDLSAYPVRELKLAMCDGSGDMLLAALQYPEQGKSQHPLVVLIHGLTGCQDSLYMLRSASVFLAAGYPVLRLSLRGAGPSRPLCRFQYHAGRSADLGDALLELPPELAVNGLLLVGYSLGGNMLLKFLAEQGRDFPVLAAGSVSAPIELAESSRRFLDHRNWLYHRWLLARMKEETLAGPPDALSTAERQAVQSVATVLEFDDRHVAPRNGFAGAADYYAKCSALHFLPAIEVPTMLIHAEDDPWIPAVSYRKAMQAGNDRLTCLLAPGGGHVGFHDASPVAWHDRCLLQFFAERFTG
ncbi:YheT family hydrolase [Oceanibaculum sp.]|uniref:YheT family hydrolase n=1 Tax=Oceanibaculum sp. TaxID=1903597 RepID=UPI0025865F53|nr:alpha/beta fold hydrolase [Oceanibaculum sp.]MCH2396160.1 alpha/beta fold hydrolase [Oceanibaculum sp.]